MARLIGLPPVLDKNTRVLVLGSFPGAASLAAAQYYAHPRNHFWKLFGVLLGEPLYDMPYAARLSVLKQNGIGLWDIITACERAGSLDSAIREAERSDFSKLPELAPKLHIVALNGGTAGKAGRELAALGYEFVVLPSSSPAYTLSFDKKLERWRELLKL